MSCAVMTIKAASLARLSVLRDEAMLRASKVARLSPVAHEWARLSREHRIVVLMLSGIDEVEELTLKDWSEFTPDEVWAMQATLRALKSAMSGVNALVRK